MAFHVHISYSRDLKTFVNFRPSASNFKSVSQSREFFFLTVGQNSFGYKISFLSQVEVKKKIANVTVVKKTVLGFAGHT